MHMSSTHARDPGYAGCECWRQYCADASLLVRRVSSASPATSGLLAITYHLLPTTILLTAYYLLPTAYYLLLVT